MLGAGRACVLEGLVLGGPERRTNDVLFRIMKSVEQVGTHAYFNYEMDGG